MSKFSHKSKWLGHSRAVQSLVNVLPTFTGHFGHGSFDPDFLDLDV